MKLLHWITVAIGVSAYALTKVIIEGENGIIVNDDGTSQVGGESGITNNADGSQNIGGAGITTNAQGQTTNVGGSSGIAIIQNGSSGNKTIEAAKNSTTSGTNPKGTGSGASDLAVLIGALQGASSGSKNGNVNANGPGEESAAAAAPTGTGSGADGLAALIGALQGVSSSGSKNGAKTAKALAEVPAPAAVLAGRL